MSGEVAAGTAVSAGAGRAAHARSPLFEHGAVGVHIGAGQHSEAKTPLYLSLCERACARATEMLRAGGSALEAVTEATKVLEDDGSTNAGYGSNLTEAGTVEMDAGIMDGQNLLFGAVGAMPGIKNPIAVAKLLVEEQRHGLLPMGRVPPGFLVGQGAKDWAMRRGVPALEQDKLISEKSDKLYKYYKRKLTLYNERQASKKVKLLPVEVINVEDEDDKEDRASESDKPEEDDKVTDTVGVVALDRFGNVASSVSSGGIALKQPGRVGQASCFGCGCWAQNKMGPRDQTIGVSTTGCGEYLVRTFLAREVAQHVGRAEAPIKGLGNCMESFASSEFLENVPEKLAGAVCIQFDPEIQRGEFMWTHTTASMGVAFQTTADEHATTRMSRLPIGPNKSLSNHLKPTVIALESIPFCVNSKEDSKPPPLLSNDLPLDLPKENNGFLDHSTLPPSSAVAS